MISKLISTKTGPAIPSEMVGIIEIRTQVELSPAELFLFSQALGAVQEQLNEEGIDISARNHVQVVFLNGDTLEMAMPNSALGMHCEFVIYSMERVHTLLKTAPASGQKRIYMVVFLEELCHAFWKSHDEIAIKHKVAEVISRRTTAPVQASDLYNL